MRASQAPIDLQFGRSRQAAAIVGAAAVLAALSAWLLPAPWALVVGVLAVWSLGRLWRREVTRTSRLTVARVVIEPGSTVRLARRDYPELRPAAWRDAPFALGPFVVLPLVCGGRAADVLVAPDMVDQLSYRRLRIGVTAGALAPPPDPESSVRHSAAGPDSRD